MTPGMPGQSTEKWEGEAVEPTISRKIIGKIMYLAK
jgi:hypothetical protein